MILAPSCPHSLVFSFSHLTLERPWELLALAVSLSHLPSVGQLVPPPSSPTRLLSCFSNITSTSLVVNSVNLSVCCLTWLLSSILHRGAFSRRNALPHWRLEHRLLQVCDHRAETFLEGSSSWSHRLNAGPCKNSVLSAFTWNCSYPVP